MRKGSVLVKRNDVVRRGERLGMIGLSGWTEFPHLHLSVRHRGKNVDPFVGCTEHADCGMGAKHLWTPAAAAALRYTPTGMLNAGFAGAAPSHGEVKVDEPPNAGGDSPALVFWITAYGVQAGDTEHIRITTPQGHVLAESWRKIPANKAEWLAYVGRRRATAPWPAGMYKASTH
jgi:murein DD-endopeptidase MepM/ murein hydrolase activator NlpD